MVVWRSIAALRKIKSNPTYKFGKWDADKNIRIQFYQCERSIEIGNKKVHINVRMCTLDIIYTYTCIIQAQKIQSPFDAFQLKPFELNYLLYVTFASPKNPCCKQGAWKNKITDSKNIFIKSVWFSFSFYYVHPTCDWSTKCGDCKRLWLGGIFFQMFVCQIDVETKNTKLKFVTRCHCSVYVYCT